MGKMPWVYLAFIHSAYFSCLLIFKNAQTNANIVIIFSSVSP